MPTPTTLEGTACSVVTGGSGHHYRHYRNGILNLTPEAASMVRLWPSYMQDGTHLRNVAEALGVEFSLLTKWRENVQDQLRVETATWGLSWWERYLNLPISLGSTDYATRRLLVQNALFAGNLESELYFVLGLQAIVGVAPMVSSGDVHLDPYSLYIELGVPYFEYGPTSVPTVSAGGGGSIAAGDYTYKVTFTYASGESPASAASDTVTVGGSGSVTVSGIALGGAGCTARKVYRKKTSEPDYTLVKTISDNTSTSFVDVLVSGAYQVLPTVSTALTTTGQLVRDYVAAAKPAHLTTSITSTSFRAGISAAGDRV